MEKKKIIWIGIAIVLVLCMVRSNSIEAAELAIRYSGETYSYNGVRAGVTLDGNMVNIGKTPGLIVNNNCMVPAKEVFASGLGGSYSYNSKSGKITIKKDSATIEMKIGSKTAYVNQKEKTLPEEPKVITFVKEKQSKVYVPSRFVTENLGYSYQWNSSKKMAEIKSPFTIKYAKDWVIYKGTQGNVTFDGKKINLSGMPSIIINNTALLRANTVFHSALGADYNYNSKTKKIIISNATATIQMQVNSKKAIVNNKEYTMSTEARLVTNKATKKSYVMVPGEFVTTSLGYSYEWNGTIKTSVITTIQEEDDESEDDYEEHDTDITDSDYQVMISLPNNVKKSDLEDEDLYYKNQFVIAVPGNRVSFYKQNPVSIDGSIVRKCAVSYSNSEDCTNLTFTTTKLQAYKLEKAEEGVGIYVADPKELYDRVVVLDPGHGGKDSGAINNSVYEKTVTFEILYNKAKEYFNGKDSTIKAYWTRTDDSYPSLDSRSKMADKVGADLFISLHMNSAGKSASGTEVLYGSNNKNTINGVDSKKMASFFQEYLVEKLGLKGRKIVDRTGLYVLKHNTVPAILIELGFLSNPDDFAKLTDEDFQDEAAKAIYEATELLYDTYIE
ncbi:N-acetylmuramoyl-L-alanine amidase [Velocimicrobium porci]|uniref:MurNAc-LAA domain-containing protein n=1 Tax=Velocimicrobium porci TaxID=2606634 RepID=A0A6L5Y180_9FIRM|nr:N-acetylmuramoyl-L-alanine amidase [Velocimicrobium porci]MSS64639.1 hypothetical protein [Velocimicrobium porci]